MSFRIIAGVLLAFWLSGSAVSAQTISAEIMNHTGFIKEYDFGIGNDDGFINMFPLPQDQLLGVSLVFDSTMLHSWDLKFVTLNQKGKVLGIVKANLDVGAYLQVERNAAGDLFVLTIEYPNERVMKLSQNYQVIWSFPLPPQIYNASEVLPTDDGGCLVGGTAIPNAKFAAQKFSAGGSSEWLHTYASPNGTQILNDIVGAANGGYLLAGAGSYGLNDTINVQRIDSTGVPLWYQEYPNNYFISNGQTLTAHLAENGGFILATTQFTYPSTDDGVLFKTDSSGNLLWKVVLSPNGSEEVLSDVAVSATGGYLAVGYKLSSQAPYSTPYLAKVSSTGQVKFEHTYAPQGMVVGWLVDIRELREGDLLMAGNAKDAGTDDEDSLLIRTNPKGQIY